ncbi:MAG TPA: ATP-dependent DNA helicase, partial [Myxococcaceae bacterium]|nr:ATP-dependent DNA helicase [Myxococcaceae bacterium]
MSSSAPSLRLSVDTLLGPGGALQSALENYEYRPEQLQMARSVEKAFSERGYLLAEAGTGTGKTLAYLVPALLSGRRVVVSTATKTLQEQIFFKDLPLLRERMGLSFEAVYLKGRSNYLCLHRYAAFSKDPQFSSREETRYWKHLQTWASRTETGDRSELELPESFNAWSRLSTTADTCLGSKCPVYESCFVTRTRRAAEAADLLVVNHHLFFADLALRSRGQRGEGGVLPPYEAVIFDEAHALEDAAGSYFGHSVSSFRLEDLVRDALGTLAPTDSRFGMLSSLVVRLRTHSEALFSQAPRVLGLKEHEGAVALNPERLALLSDSIEQVKESLSALSAFTLSEHEPELTLLTRRCAELVADLSFLEKVESHDHVYWAEARGRGVFLRASPIEIARELQERLYGGVDTVVFTSATLAAEGRFDFFARRMGL